MIYIHYKVTIIVTINSICILYIYMYTNVVSNNKIRGYNSVSIYKWQLVESYM